MNQSGQRWDKYRFLPCGMAVVVEEAGPQWANGRWNTITDSNQEESRKHEEGQGPAGVWMQCYNRTETTQLPCSLIPQVRFIQNRKKISQCAIKNLHPKTVLLHNARWSSVSPCCCSYLFPVFEIPILIFYVWAVIWIYRCADDEYWHISFCTDPVETYFRRLWWMERC